MSQLPIVKSENVYERELNEESFRLCMNALIKLPVVITDEPNMITVRRKNGTRDYEFQIWRETDAEYEFTLSPGGRINPETFNLNDTKYVKKNDYLILLCHGADPVDPMNYQ